MSATEHSLVELEFSDARLLATLEEAFSDPRRFDELGFGLIAMELDGTVAAYNRLEAELSGISPGRCIGLNFFTDVAPCTNNYLVAGRFEDEADLDETIDYVFTLKMHPTRVILRLLKAESAAHQYLAVKRR
jgi:photoactive yellow protein